MGLFYKGISTELARKLAKKYHLRYFVETGTLMGRTAIWAAKSGLFQRIWTVELDLQIYNKMLRAVNSFSYPNIQFFQGDSRDVLKNKILREVKGQILFWLDAHWSKDLPYGRPVLGECPIIAEIDAIQTSGIKSHVILIDDARLFLEHPAHHKKDDWPRFSEIQEKLNGYSVGIFDDIIVAIPEG